MDSRLVIKQQWLHLDLQKVAKAPEGLLEPDLDHGVGSICVSVVFRPVPVHTENFAYGKGASFRFLSLFIPFYFVVNSFLASFPFALTLLALPAAPHLSVESHGRPHFGISTQISSHEVPSSIHLLRLTFFHIFLCVCRLVGWPCHWRSWPPLA